MKNYNATKNSATFVNLLVQFLEILAHEIVSFPCKLLPTARLHPALDTAQLDQEFAICGILPAV